MTEMNRGLNAETEALAYEKYVEIFGDPALNINSELHEELSFAEYAERFPNFNWIPETEVEEGCYSTYTVINTVSSVRGEARWSHQPIFTFGGPDGYALMESELMKVHPGIPDIIFSDMISCSTEYEEQTYRDFYTGKILSVVLDFEEHFDPREYFHYVWFAVETEPAAKTVTVYGKEEAIGLFHEKFSSQT